MAVFTPVSDEDAARFLAGYGVGDLVSLEAVAEGVENTNYRLQTTGGVYALTLFEKRVAERDLPFYLGLTEHLAARDYPAPAPVRDRQGRLTGNLNGRPAALIAWLPGAWLRDPTPEQARTAGAALARLHLASADFAPTLPNALGPAGWRALVGRCATKAQGEHAAMLAHLGAAARAATAAWPSDLPTGVIHADYFPDNVLFDGNAVSGVIDYYFACTDFLAYDLAVALNAWGFRADGSPNPALLSAFAQGYDQARPLTPAERDALPLLCRGSAVRFSLSRLHDLIFHDPSWRVTPKDPAPFLARLAFHEGVTDARAYGL